MDKKRPTLDGAKDAFARHLKDGRYAAARRVVVGSLLPSAPEYLADAADRRAFSDYIGTLLDADKRGALAHAKSDSPQAGPSTGGAP